MLVFPPFASLDDRVAKLDKCAGNGSPRSVGSNPTPVSLASQDPNALANSPFSCPGAPVAKLVDALDWKSSGPALQASWSVRVQVPSEVPAKMPFCHIDTKEY